MVCLTKAKSERNFVDATVMELPAYVSIAEIEKRFPGFTDPSVTWKCESDHGVGETAKRECRELIESLPCPRCKRAGNTVIEIWQYWRGGIISVDCRPIVEK